MNLLLKMPKNKLTKIEKSGITIAIDALAISRKSAGSFTVLIGLVRELVNLCDYKFVIYVACSDIEYELGSCKERIDYVYTPSWAKKFLLRLFWQQLILPKLARKSGCKLIYSAAGYPELLASLPVVSHQQNLWSFAKPKQWWTVKNRIKSFLRRRIASSTLRSSDANIFISDYLRDCANNLFPETKDKNFTVHNAVFCLDGHALKDFKADWIDKEFCISVGSVIIHKNYEVLLRAFSIINRNCPDLYLIIVGNYNTIYGQRVKDLCQRLRLNSRVIFTGALKLEEILYLYKKAVFSINVSLLEGFGIPVLESLVMASPVICSDIPAFREIASDAAIYCNSRIPEDIAEKAIRFYADENKRRNLATKGLERASKFSWNNSAKKLLVIFDKFLRVQ